ncbi:MAG: ribosome maturation factor RimP [Clostridia bacterium]
MENDLIKIENCVRPIVENLGYELVYVKLHKPYGIDTVTVIIFKPNGIMSLKDCEDVHKAIDSPLDDINYLDDRPYTLEVSSMGLDWPLKNFDDFRRCFGKNVDVSFIQPVNGVKKISGIVDEVMTDSVRIVETVQKAKPVTNTYVVMFDNIKKATQTINFK